jgi:hypothetical protein
MPKQGFGIRPRLTQGSRQNLGSSGGSSPKSLLIGAG